MKFSRAALSALITLTLAFTAISCKSTQKAAENTEETESTGKTVKVRPAPPVLTEIPVIEYRTPGIKYEFEFMYLHHFLVLQDDTASGGFCTRLNDEGATAQMKVRLPAGTYECMVSEKAYDTDHSAFYVYIDTKDYRVYPSNPPLNTWELTTRCPIYFTIEEPRTILVTVQANSEKKLGNTQMCLDYIQFVKRD